MRAVAVGTLLSFAVPVAQAQQVPAQQTPANQAPANRVPAVQSAPKLKPTTAPSPQVIAPASAQAQTPPAPVAAAPAAKPLQSWSEAEIKAAQSQCVERLKGLDLVAIGAAPIREGDCGTPAPIELISVGISPQVTFTPPVTVTCDMAAALHKWVTGDLQPLAKKHLGSQVVRIDTMSSYSCRNAYGRAGNRMSEHGKANALDIRSFLTTKADTIDLIADWGLTARDIHAQIAAAKVAKEKADAAKALAGRVQPPVPVPGQSAPTGQAPSAVAGTSSGRPGISIGVPGGGPALDLPRPDTAIGLTAPFPGPSRLGGPRLSDLPAPLAMPVAKGGAKPANGYVLTAPASEDSAFSRQNQATNGRMLFLRDAHATACRIFGTVLGPEANNAHRNHFHLDMAPRATGAFCE